MLMYLYGTDSYRRSKKLAEILSAYTTKHGAITHEAFFMQEKGALDRLREFLGNQSLFGNVRLAVVYHPDEAEGSAKLLKESSEDKTKTIVVISDKKLPKEFSFLLKKPALTQEFEALREAEFYAFIKKEALERGATLTPETLRMLAEALPGDMWGIVTNLEKIALGGEVNATIQTPAFFPLVQALKKQGDIRSRLRALGHLLETEEPAAVFNVTASIADPALKIKMADYDIAIKSGKLEYEEALLDLALS